MSLRPEAVFRWSQLEESQERHLIEQAKKGDNDARGELINWHIDVVASRAHRFCRRGAFLEVDDLIQYGCLGILRAIDKFDPERRSSERRARFVTYAGYWIDHFMYRSIEKYCRTVTMSLSAQRDLRKLYRAKDQACFIGHTNTDFESLSQELGMSQRRCKLAYMASHETISLDDLSDDEHAGAPLDNCSNRLRDDSEHLAIEKENHRSVQRALGCLPDRERQMIKNLFGLEDSERKTSQEVGKLFGVSPARIAQLKNRAVKRIRDFILANET